MRSPCFDPTDNFCPPNDLQYLPPRHQMFASFSLPFCLDVEQSSIQESLVRNRSICGRILHCSYGWGFGPVCASRLFVEPILRRHGRPMRQQKDPSLSHGRAQYRGRHCSSGLADANTLEPAATLQAEARVVHDIFSGHLVSTSPT